MTTKSTSILEPTLADAFDVGKTEGLKEAFTEIKQMISNDVNGKELRVYIEARLKSVQTSNNNPFKQKDG